MSRRQHLVHGDPQRFEVVADFIAAHYGNTIHYIADVAGGKGILTRLLGKKKNFTCELIDPRRTVLNGIDHRPEQFDPEMADYYDLLVGTPSGRCAAPTRRSSTSTTRCNNSGAGNFCG